MAKFRVGIDIGGGSIKLVLLSTSIERSSIAKTPKNKKAFFGILGKMLESLPIKDISGIGIGAPGIVDRRTDKITAAPNLPFLKGLELKKFLVKFNRNVFFDNDVKCILRAEKAIGAARELESAILIALGTGIGGAVLINGKIYYGKNSAGEVGKMILDKGKTFEDLAGGKTLKTHSDREIRRVSKYLGLACANLINELEPEAIILSGGIVHHRPKQIVRYSQPYVKKFVLDPKAKNTPLIPGKLGELAGAMGAALLVK